MSKMFFERMRTELFILFVEARREKVQRDLDDEVERITGKECDEAARTLSRADFKRVAEEAMKNIKKRKQKLNESATTKDVEVAAYA